MVNLQNIGEQLPSHLDLHNFRVDKGYRDQADDRIFLVLRSLPGRETSIVIRHFLEASIRDELKSFASISTEDFFPQRNGRPIYQSARIREHQNATYDRATQLFLSKINLVILNNFNIRRVHFNHYVNTAKTFGYTVVEATVGSMTPSDKDLAQLSLNSGMSTATIKDMGRTYEE